MEAPLDTVVPSAGGGNQVPVPPAVPPTPPPPAGVPSDMMTALASYKANYAAYVVSGEASYKTAYENALGIINNAISNLESATQVNESSIQGFLASYASENGEMVDLQARSQAIQTQGPALADELARTERLHSSVPTTVDSTALYVKSAIVVGLLVAIGIVGII